MVRTLTPYRTLAPQDMPGWGEDVNIRRYLRTVISFLLSRRAKDFEALGGGGCSPTARKVESSSSSQLKHSITACLYFLPPHRMKPIDVVIMSAVSKLVRTRDICIGQEGRRRAGRHM